MTAVPGDVAALIRRAAADGGRVLFLTGAGISAESGIPTFRGPDGYWTVGSREYQAQELATRSAFSRVPEAVWAWYLHRRARCLAAEPNAAHAAVAALDDALGDRFRLITQNVDGLHGRAGSTPERTYEIHGNIQLMRCFEACGPELVAVPEEVGLDWPRGKELSRAVEAFLRCDRCGAWARPHVLWFDECYDEERFRFESSLRVAAECSLLVVVGTAGQTNLPLQVTALAARRGAALLVVNPEPTPFTRLAADLPTGAVLAGAATAWVPAVSAAIRAAADGADTLGGPGDEIRR